MIFLCFFCVYYHILKLCQLVAKQTVYKRFKSAQFLVTARPAISCVTEVWSRRAGTDVVSIEFINAVNAVHGQTNRASLHTVYPGFQPREEESTASYFTGGWRRIYGAVGCRLSGSAGIPALHYVIFEGVNII
ncbi:hypothetical protein J6590_055189 [Homalodisca vitripennis]|nr:hypothetical protein J6590_055189 [Homalodisca vitripennis]